MAPPTRPVYVIDGQNFSDFAGFIEIEECNRGFIRDFGGEWNGNLDVFSDYLYWPDGNYVLVWRNSGKSRKDLGHEAMANWLEAEERGSLLLNEPSERERLDRARRGEGPTLFDWLVEIIREERKVELRLE